MPLLWHLLTVALPIARCTELRHLDDMVERVFPIGNETLRMEAEIDRHFASTKSLRAGVVLLLKDLRCGGRPCKQNAKWGKCTYLDQAIRSIGSLLRPESLMGKYPQYPILLYHSDWTRSDQQTVERASGLGEKGHRAWWQRVTFGPESLPPYLYDVNRTVAGWRELHVGGDLTRATKDNIHGFGYMLMCRLYSGLIHHAPLARKLDYYLRVDGDSRLSKVNGDPFARMASNGKKYATFVGRSTYKEIAGAAIALPYEYVRRFGAGTSLPRHKECPGQSVACPTVALAATAGRRAVAAGRCDLDCPLNLPDDSSETPMPVPLCRRKSVSPTGAAPTHCPAFYNNFEIVDMRAFRTSSQWEFFLLAEMAHVFLCEAFPRRSRAGKCGGGGMGDAMFRTIQVNTFLAPQEIQRITTSQLAYHHPVPIASFCNAKGGMSDGGPSVQPISDVGV